MNARDEVMARINGIEALWADLPRCHSCGEFATGTIHNPTGDRKYACGMCNGRDFLGFHAQPALAYIEPLMALTSALRRIIEAHEVVLFGTFDPDGSLWSCRGCDWRDETYADDPAPSCPNGDRAVAITAQEIGE